MATRTVFFSISCFPALGSDCRSACYTAAGRACASVDDGVDRSADLTWIWRNCRDPRYYTTRFANSSTPAGVDDVHNLARGGLSAMDGQALVLGLRLLHVVGGVFWVGAMTVLAWFLFPAVRAAGPEGGRVMQGLMTDRRMGMWMGIAGGLTVLSGLTLFARYASATDGAWVRTPAGVGYSIGAVAALLGMGVGLGLGMRSMMRVQRIAAEAAGSPSPAQAAEMERLQARAGAAAKVTAGLLLFAAAVMGTARYW
jgi:uncharacterized membrane protein